MLLTDLADACRKSGLPVEEVPGWKDRGHGPLTAVETIVCHHTATSKAAAGDYPSLAIVRDGRSDLPGPLAQLGLGRNGTVYVIAAGVAYHAGKTFFPWQDNWRSIGIEAEADGLSPWPDAQMDAYARLCAALAEHYDVPVARVQGHREVAAPAGRKVDPNFDMNALRERVRNLGDDMPLTDDDVTRVAVAVRKELAARDKRVMDRLNQFADAERKRDKAAGERIDALVAEIRADS